MGRRRNRQSSKEFLIVRNDKSVSRGAFCALRRKYGQYVPIITGKEVDSIFTTRIGFSDYIRRYPRKFFHVIDTEVSEVSRDLARMTGIPFGVLIKTVKFGKRWWKSDRINSGNGKRLVRTSTTLTPVEVFVGSPHKEACITGTSSTFEAVTDAIAHRREIPIETARMN